METISGSTRGRRAEQLRSRAEGIRRTSSPSGVDERERDGKEAMGVPENESAHVEE